MSLVKDVVSIQVQTTRLTGAGVTVVPYKSKSGEATHWSLYTRHTDGAVSWKQDIVVMHGNPAPSFTEAMIAAAKLSIEHAAYIEPIQ